MGIRVFVFCFILILAGSQAISQDIIKKHTGEQIEAVIVDVSPGVIKYRKFDKPQGPVYSIAREQVSEIIYESGKTTSFEQEEKQYEQTSKETPTSHTKPSPVLGWHLSLGVSSIYGDISGAKTQMASAIGATFSLPTGKNNTVLFGFDILSLGCGFEDMDVSFDDGSSIVITNANEDLGYVSLLIADRYFLNSGRNIYIEGGGYGSFLMNAITSGDAEITDTNGFVTSGSFSDNLIDYYKAYDFGLFGGLGGRVPLGKSGKWNLTIEARFYYGLTNIWDPAQMPGSEDYSESNIFGLLFVGVDIPTRKE